MTDSRCIDERNQLDDSQLLCLAAAGQTWAIDLLLERHKGLVRRKASSLFMAGADHEDVLQEGMIGLFQAIRDYQPEHQVPFTAFASLCVTARINDAIRRASRLKHAPLNESLSLHRLLQDEDQNRPMLDLFADTSIPDPEKKLLERENLNDLQYFIRHELSPLERDAVLSFLNDPAYETIAMRLGCSVKSVDNALQRARRKFSQFRRK